MRYPLAISKRSVKLYLLEGKYKTMTNAFGRTLTAKEMARAIRMACVDGSRNHKKDCYGKCATCGKVFAV